MRYAIARYQSQQRDLAYRIYVTDCLRIQLECIAEMTHHNLDAPRFIDTLNPKPVDNRTADDIIDGIRNKLK
jgi:hypothetical protein